MNPFADTDSCHEFTYTSLPDTGAADTVTPHIRLVEVHDCDSDNPTMRLSIHSFSMEDAPSYHAISYTWGDEKDQERILVKHASCSSEYLLETETGRYGLMTVRKNCADVLRQLLHFKTSRYYWIDAICINQRNLEEKSVQVWRMGETFRQADTVLVCIGMHDESSRLVVSMFESFHSHISKLDVLDMLEVKLTKRHFAPELEISKKVKGLEELVFDWVQSIDTGLFIEFYRAMMTLARRLYFWRIWTLQELWLVRQLRSFCGEDELHLPSFVWWCQGTSTWDKQSLEGRPQLQLLVGLMYDHNQYHSGYWADLGRTYERILRGFTGGSSQTSWKYTCHALIDLCRGRGCQDPRDVIYGTLSMVNWSGGLKGSDTSSTELQDKPAPILPDYSQSAFELAKRVLPILARQYDYIRFELLEEMCAALHLGPQTEEIRRGLALRSGPGFWEPGLASLEGLQRTKDPRYVIHHTMEGYRLDYTEPLPYLQSASDETRTFTRILYYNDYDDTKTCVALACADAQDGDWIVPILYGRALILRECGSYLSFIGKALTNRDTYYLSTTKPIEVELGLDDLIIFLCGLKIDWLYQIPRQSNEEFVAITADRKLVGNEETVLAWLDGQFCGERNSSWALAPTAAGDEVNE